MSAADRARVADTIRNRQQFLLATHTHPDGDAIGSLVGLRELLLTLGKEVTVFLPQQDVILPTELEHSDLGVTVDEAAVSLGENVVVFVDCGNAERSTLIDAAGQAELSINIDHHHDNTHFATLNHVDPDASCTAELIWGLALELGVPVEGPMAEALYIGLVTDTGRFMYENTTPRAHAMAAAMIEAGVDQTGVRKRLYEEVDPAKLKLLRYALDSMSVHGGGALVLARITAEDFAAADGTEAHAEGIIDVLRTLRGVRIAALARELAVSPGTFKVSLRAADPTIDVSAIARASGGGGHPQAAGLTTQLPDGELAQFILDQMVMQGGGGVAV